MPSIAMLHTEWNGCAHWRIFEPARHLEKLKGWEVKYFPTSKQLVGDIDYYYDLCKNVDLIVSMRADNFKAVKMLMVLRHILKVPLVFETDDDFTKVDPANISARHWEEGREPRNAALIQLQESDMLQFSTMPLKRAFGYKLNKPTWVMPNLIDIEKVSKLRKPNDTGKIRIGWAGSASHYMDFKIVWPAIERILDEYNNVELVVAGMKTDYMHVGDGDNRRFRDKLEFIEAGDFKGWNKVMANMKCDIAITPLEPIHFNECKSNCRYLEWSSLKVPGIYSASDPYANSITDGIDGFCTLTKTGFNRSGSKYTLDNWYNNLKALIESKQLREDMGQSAFDNVEANYSLKNNISIWANNYKEMIDMKTDLSDIDLAEKELNKDGINLRS